MSICNFIVPLGKAAASDIECIGRRNAYVSQMIGHLGKEGVNIPGGFVFTVNAYKHFLLFNGLEPAIRKCLCAIDYNNITSLRRGARKIRWLIMHAEFSPELQGQLLAAYNELSEFYQVADTYVSLHPSIEIEEDPDALFMSQQSDYQHVRGLNMLMNTIKQCFAALFTDQAINYRHQLGYRHFNMGLSVCVRKMIRTGMASAGMAFSLDRGMSLDAVLINASYGSGNLIASEEVSPDEYIVLKKNLRESSIPVIQKKLGTKEKMMICNNTPYDKITFISTDKDMRERFCLTDEQVLTIAGWVTAIEKYAQQQGNWFPLNIEWAIDGRTNQLFVVEVSRLSLVSLKKVAAVLKSHFAVSDKMVHIN